MQEHKLITRSFCRGSQCPHRGREVMLQSSQTVPPQPWRLPGAEAPGQQSSGVQNSDSLSSDSAAPLCSGAQGRERNELVQGRAQCRCLGVCAASLQVHRCPGSPGLGWLRLCSPLQLSRRAQQSPASGLQQKQQCKQLLSSLQGSYQQEKKNSHFLFSVLYSRNHLFL